MKEDANAKFFTNEYYYVMNLENILKMTTYPIDAEVNELIIPYQTLFKNKNSTKTQLGYLLSQYFFHYNFLVRITGLVKTEREIFSDFYDLFISKREEIMEKKIKKILEGLKSKNSASKTDKGIIIVGEYHFDNLKILLNNIPK